MRSTRMFVGFGNEPRVAFLDAHEVAKKKMGGVFWVIHDAYFVTVGLPEQMHIVCNMIVKYREQ